MCPVSASWRSLFGKDSTHRVAGIVGRLAMLAELRAGVCLRATPRQQSVRRLGGWVDVAATLEVGIVFLRESGDDNCYECDEHEREHCDCNVESEVEGDVKA